MLFIAESNVEVVMSNEGVPSLVPYLVLDPETLSNPEEEWIEWR